MSPEPAGRPARIVSDNAFVIAASLALLPFFVVLKILLVIDDIHAGATAAPGLVRMLARVVLALHRDVLFIAVLGLVVRAILWIPGKSATVHRALQVAIIALYAFLAAWATGTLFIWRVVSGMLTIGLYRLSGGIFQMDPGVAASLPPVLPYVFGSALGFIALEAILVRRLPIDRWLAAKGRIIAIAAGAAALVVLGVAFKFRKNNVDLRETPMHYFFMTWLTEPPDFGAGMKIEVDSEKLYGPPKNKASTHKATPPAPPKTNVILLVLESTGAKYMHAFSGKYDNTPVLDGLKANGSALFFDRAYAHAPMTNESALTLQCAIQPRTGTVPTVGSTARLKMHDLAGELHDQGYKTAFMCQTLLGWQGKQFFQERHFDLYQEEYEYWRDWGGTRKMDDRDLLPKAFKWIDEQKTPFFLMLWTYQGHYPCYAVDDQQPYEPGHAPLNRYLNAIREDDRFVGMLMKELEKRGILDNTLIVITGDHGQAFSAEATERAARDLSDLALRVPLVFINPKLVGKSGVDNRLARHTDIAPTILDLLGLDAPPEWQGMSLLGDDKISRVFLTSSYKDPVLYGMVDGTKKYITDGRREHLYDLATDPEQKNDLAEDSPDACKQYKELLVGWHRYQPPYIDRFVVR